MKSDSCNQHRCAAQRAVSRVAFVLLAALVLGGCRLEMYDQPKLKGYRPSTLFDDSLGVRPYIPGTVARGNAWPEHFSDAKNDTSVGTITSTAEMPIDSSNPYKVSALFIKRGHERFDIFCSPCHGRAGDAKGMIVQRGMPTPPTYHSDRLRGVSDGYIYGVITNGFGVMYSYASRIPPEDRWAIVAYIRALQLSQNATPEALSGRTMSATTAQPGGTR